MTEGGRLRNRVKNWALGRSLFLPTGLLNDEILLSYYEELRRFQPKVLQAYPTPLYHFASFLEGEGLKLSIPYINVAAEYLYDFQREKIESIFGTKIFNWYGARELGHLATECKEHCGLHINSYGVDIEALRNGEAVYDEVGELVITDLWNYALPLIRYRIGDLGIISRKRCPCGSGLPLLSEVGGRLTDTFKKRDGTIIPGIALTNRVIKEHLGIQKLQIIQKDYDLFELKVVKGEKFRQEDIESLEESICRFMQAKLSFQIALVDDIAPEKSGKVRFCKCEMNHAEDRPQMQ